MTKCVLFGAVLALGCGGSHASQPTLAEPMPEPAKAQAKEAPDASAAYGPLEVGADYASYTKVSTEPFASPTHGNRFVEVYVNDIGLDAYQHGGEIPVGAVIVKTSFERGEDDQPSDVAGPIFVMEKRAAGFSAAHDDWYYAMHWADPPAKWQQRLGGPVYWRSPSTKVDYCWRCHESYDRKLGMVPEAYRTWTEK